MLCIHPGETAASYLDTYREELTGRSKMFVDMSVPFSRLGFPAAGPQVSTGACWTPATPPPLLLTKDLV
eukprot:400575-Amphidinium_carterae.1